MRRCTEPTPLLDKKKRISAQKWPRGDTEFGKYRRITSPGERTEKALS
jgi:hypothetical protein